MRMNTEYSDKLAKKFGLENSHGISTPIENRLNLRDVKQCTKKHLMKN